MRPRARLVTSLAWLSCLLAAIPVAGCASGSGPGPGGGTTTGSPSATTPPAGSRPAPNSTATLSPWSGPTKFTVSGYPDEPTSVSCPAAGQCVAVDNFGYAYTYAAGKWSDGLLLGAYPDQDADDLTAVSCPRVGVCVAVSSDSGDIYALRGARWSATQIDDHGQGVDAVSCATTIYCVAVAGSGWAWTGSPDKWSLGTLMDNDPAVLWGGWSVSCPSTSFCATVGNGHASFETAGTWAIATQLSRNEGDADDLMSVSCPSTTFCAAVGGDGSTNTYSRGQWSATDWLDPYHSLTSVSCPTASFCVAVDSSGYVFKYSAGTWSNWAKIADQSLTSVSCATEQFCVAASSTGASFTYSKASPELQPVTYRGQGSGQGWCSAYGGGALASYDNVYACAPNSSPSSAGATPFDAAPGFQCTELANRYLFDATGAKISDANASSGALYGGNFVLTASSLTGVNVGTAAGRALPAPGDIVSMWGGASNQAQTGAGTHVAVVTAVSEVGAGWRIATLNQNDRSDKDGQDGLNYINVAPDGSWSFNGGYYTEFDWLELG